MNASASTRHADIISAWNDLHHDARQGGLGGFVRWVGSVLPSSRIPDVLDLPQEFVAAALASSGGPVRPRGHTAAMRARKRALEAGDDFL